MIAYYSLHTLGIRPHEWAEMDHQEKAFIYASILFKTEQEEKVREQLKAQS